MRENTTMKKSKLRLGSSSVRVMHELERRIVSGELAPGSRIEEANIARELGVSRTPVRKALHQLIASQLLTQTPNKSAVVPLLDREEFSDIFEALSEIEAIIAGFAAQRMREMERQEIVACAKRCLETEEPEAYGSLNEEFHNLIDIGARNQSLQSVVKMVRIRAAPYRRYQFTVLDRIRQSSEEHLNIAEALRTADVEGATTSMRNHIISAGATVMSIVLKFK
jgi:DNA-binding GntR family transcriptional regulator